MFVGPAPGEMLNRLQSNFIFCGIIMKQSAKNVDMYLQYVWLVLAPKRGDRVHKGTSLLLIPTEKTVTEFSFEDGANYSEVVERPLWENGAYGIDFNSQHTP